MGMFDGIEDATVSKSTSTVTILNSRGAHVSYTKSVFSISAHGTLVKDTDMLFVSDSAASCHPIREVSDLASAIRLQLEHSKDIVPAPGEDDEATVIFTPRGVVRALLSPLLAGLNGKAVLQKSSTAREPSESTSWRNGLGRTGFSTSSVNCSAAPPAGG